MHHALVNVMNARRWIVPKCFALFVVAIVGAMLSNASLVRAQGVRTSPDDVINWARGIQSTHAGLRDLLSKLDDGYKVVFIPGIMGSKLTIGDFVWGDSAVQADKLALPNELTKPPQVLETFSVPLTLKGLRVPWFSNLLGKNLTKTDIYGRALDDLNADMGGKEPLPFPYDWRQDLDQVASDFDKFAAENLRGKKVVVVAHSMGGLMFWRWKNRTPKDRRPFTLLALVVVGSPLEGSCEVARMLIDGYQPYQGASGFEEVAYRVIFSEAHAAMFTFPSVFELLWYGGKSCVALETDGLPKDQDLLEPGFWHRRFSNRFLSFARSVGVPGQTDNERLSTYEDRIKDAIAKAKTFRSSFDRNEDGDLIYYLYSEKPPVPMRYVVRDNGGSLSIVKTELEVAGDGRVPKESATNAEFRQPENGRVYALDLAHGELLSDPKLGNFVSDDIQNTVIQCDKACQIAAFAQADPTLRKQYSAMRLLACLSRNCSSGDQGTTVAAANVAAITGEPEPSLKAGKREARVLEDAKENPAAAKIVYQSLAVLAERQEKPLDARTLNRYGYLLLRDNRSSEAVAVLQQAAKVAEKGGDPYLKAELKGKIYGNLGTALVRAAYPTQALSAYEAAPSNPVAANNLRSLRRETETGRR